MRDRNKEMISLHLTIRGVISNPLLILLSSSKIKDSQKHSYIKMTKKVELIVHYLKWNVLEPQKQEPHDD